MRKNKLLLVLLSLSVMVIMLSSCISNTNHINTDTNTLSFSINGEKYYAPFTMGTLCNNGGKIKDSDIRKSVEKGIASDYNYINIKLPSAHSDIVTVSGMLKNVSNNEAFNYENIVLNNICFSNEAIVKSEIIVCGLTLNISTIDDARALLGKNLDERINEDSSISCSYQTESYQIVFLFVNNVLTTININAKNADIPSVDGLRCYVALYNGNSVTNGSICYYFNDADDIYVNVEIINNESHDVLYINQESTQKFNSSDNVTYDYAETGTVRLDLGTADNPIYTFKDATSSIPLYDNNEWNGNTYWFLFGGE